MNTKPNHISEKYYYTDNELIQEGYTVDEIVDIIPQWYGDDNIDI